MNSPAPASIASSQPDQRQLRLISAAAQANEARIRDILAEDPPWTSNADHDALRQALQKLAMRGKLGLVRLLLEYGAEVNARRDNETPALVRAAEGGHAFVVQELLARGADPHWCANRAGQTALFAACFRGYNVAARVLLDDGGALVDARDREERTPLLALAAERQGRRKWNLETAKLLLARGASIQARDQLGRTPLIWAATNGDVDLTRLLLDYNADVSAANHRGRTALHLAAESNHRELVALLLEAGADPLVPSDGGWQPLHNAAQSGHADVVSLLLDAKADVNAVLLNGMTALHWGAFCGFYDVVQLILTRPEANLNIKDSFGRTPLMCAFEQHHAHIVHLLSPARSAGRLSKLEEDACKAFDATVVDFGQFDKRQLVSKHSVYDLLYGWDQAKETPTVPTLPQNIKYKPDFRWIHLPANNIAWVETLLAKNFIEAGHRDIESFKALGKCFDQEHRGYFAHAHFMRTFCQRVTSHHHDSPDRSSREEGLGPVDEETSQVPRANEGELWESKPKKKTKSELLAERHPKKRKRKKGPPGNPPGRQDSFPSVGSTPSTASLPWDTSKSCGTNGKIVLFMPFLHFETDQRRREMSRSIDNARTRGHVPDNASRDSLLVHAYLNNKPPLHPRRTLDQYFYHGIDTSTRDTDQVVYRYCERQHVEPKVVMVDQLWLWIIGKDLVISCFPQRWDQPKRDPLNVLDSIIEETNAKTRPPVQSIFDLAMLITSCCSGMFDRRRLDDQDYQFLDMFESSIGLVTHRETQLFNRFYRASAQSTRLLQRNRRLRAGVEDRRGRLDGCASEHEIQTDELTDALLEIGTETSLLAEIKDVRDELNILAAVLEAQLAALDDFAACLTEELRGGGGGGGRATVEGLVAEIRRRAREQRRRLEVIHANEIQRMDRQADNLYTGLTDLLDLKQKHSNALEARFAADQAVIAAKQGQTIMVFTIVTIIFLPMSFIAAFFAINLEDWGDGLTVAYVSKYIFGIGVGISIPLIAMAFTIDGIADVIFGLLSRLRRRVNWPRDGEGDGGGGRGGVGGVGQEKGGAEEMPREFTIGGFSTRGPPSTKHEHHHYYEPLGRPRPPPPRDGGGGGGGGGVLPLYVPGHATRVDHHDHAPQRLSYSPETRRDSAAAQGQGQGQGVVLNGYNGSGGGGGGGARPWSTKSVERRRGGGGVLDLERGRGA